MGERWEFEGIPEVWTELEKGGADQLLIAQLSKDDSFPDTSYVRFCSWRDDGRDHDVHKVVGKRIRITVEVLDDEQP